MTSEELYKRIERLAADFESQQIEIFRWFHQHPELAYHEFETSKYIQEHLGKLSGIETSLIAKTGIKAVLHGNKPGLTVAIRSDIDALPVKEETGLPYASKVKTEYNGQETYVAHVCGHDASTTAATTRLFPLAIELLNQSLLFQHRTGSPLKNPLLIGERFRIPLRGFGLIEESFEGASGHRPLRLDEPIICPGGLPEGGSELSR